MRTIRYIIAFIFFISLCIAQTGVAVINFEAKGVSETEASALTDRFRDELFKTGQYKVMERAMMEEILKEQGFQLSGCTSDECVIEIGKLIGVEQIIGGSISKVGNVFSVSSRMISVETSEVSRVANYDFPGDIGTLLTQGMKNAAIQLATGNVIRSEQALKTVEGTGTGSLYISSTPSDAEVWIDNQKVVGKTPLFVENQSSSKHKIYVQKEDYSADTTVIIEADDVQKVKLVLKLGSGTVKVISTPFEANVYLDDDYKGKSPLVIKDITVGSHSLIVGKIGYNSEEKMILIKSNKTEEVRITLSEFSFTYGDEITDVDGNVYRTVKIDNQWWMAENLKVTHFRNGEAIPNVTDNTAWSNLSTGAYCNYDNDANNATTYGRLYNWYAVNASRNIAPDGWHVPTDAEWTTLTTYLGGESVAGGILKESGTAHWISPNTGATSESGFAALPGGCRGTNGYFGGMGDNAFFWSSTEYDRDGAWSRELSYGRSDIYGMGNKRFGFSVRLVRD